MFKLDREIRRVNISVFQYDIAHLCCDSSLIYEGKSGKWVIGLWHFICRSTVFILDNQVVRIFRLKNRLIILRTVTYVIHEKMCF